MRRKREKNANECMFSAHEHIISFLSGLFLSQDFVVSVFFFVLFYLLPINKNNYYDSTRFVNYNLNNFNGAHIHLFPAWIWLNK